MSKYGKSVKRSRRKIMFFGNRLSPVRLTERLTGLTIKPHALENKGSYFCKVLSLWR